MKQSSTFVVGIAAPVIFSKEKGWTLEKMSRNLNIYTPEELQAFTSKPVSVPAYIENVAVPNAVGKVTKTEWDGQNLWYEAEIYDEETVEKIRKGLVQHVSVGADYETLDMVDGKISHGLHNAELSLCAATKELGIASEVCGLTEEYYAVLKQLKETEGKLTEAQKQLEKSKTKSDIAESLLKKPTEPMMPINEAIKILETLLPSPTVERSTMGMQRECQAIRHAIFKLKEGIKGA